MVQGIDCASKLDARKAAAVKEAGYAFVGRYLVPNEGNLSWKALTRQEAEAICGAGLRLLTVWETTADRVKGGAGAGAADGLRARQVAESIGMPKHGIIYFAVDYEARAGEMRTIADYLRAARQQTGPYEIGVYGSFDVVEEMAVQGVCKGFWQCLGWSYGKKSAYRNVYQWGFNKTVAGVPVDFDECEDMDRAGLWSYGQEERIPEQGVEQNSVEKRLEVIEHNLNVWANAHNDLVERVYDLERWSRSVDAELGEYGREIGTLRERFNTVAELPEWSREAVTELCRAGILRGVDGSTDMDGLPARLDLSPDMLRLLVVLYRCGLHTGGCGPDSCDVTGLLG